MGNLEKFELIAKNLKSIDELKLQMNELSQANEILIKELENEAERTQNELDGEYTGLQVRCIQGKSSTDYDEDGIYKVLTEDERKMVFTNNPKLEKDILKAMLKSEKLDATIVEPFITKKDGKKYYKFEKKK